MRLMHKELLALSLMLTITSCSNMSGHPGGRYAQYSPPTPTFSSEEEYASRIPQQVATNEKIVVVYPEQHVWGAYEANGKLVKTGVATAGSYECEDEPGRSCRTGIGTFRVASLGDEDCRSKQYPKPKGGGLMPYCMFFNNGEALHGSPDPVVVEDNISHGCVRMRIPDAEWLRFNFVQLGTKVKVMPY